MTVCCPLLTFFLFFFLFIALSVFDDYNCHNLKFFWERNDASLVHFARRSLVAILLALISTLLSLLVGCCAAQVDKEQYVVVWKVGAKELPRYVPARRVPEPPLPRPVNPPTARPLPSPALPTTPLPLPISPAHSHSLSDPPLPSISRVSPSPSLLSRPLSSTPLPSPPLPLLSFPLLGRPLSSLSLHEAPLVSTSIDV